MGISEKTKFILEVRTAVANYMASEGCTCCQNVEKHVEHEKKLAELLKVDPYEDGSGFDFSKYETDK